MVFHKKAYNNFLLYEKKRFYQDSDSWFGVEKVNQRKKEEIFDNYYKISFYRFLSNIKRLVFFSDPFDFIKKGWGDNWEMEIYISFLKKEELIDVYKNKIVLKNKEFFNHIPKSQTEKEIKDKIERKTKRKIKENEAVVLFINEFGNFKVKGKWDQMPISQSSALFSVKKILDYIPLNKKFLFIGDDDFLSVFLSFANKEIESLVIDTDRELLDCINTIASRFNLKIETKLIDTRKKIELKKDFVGFWCNPPYTEKGIKSFIEYGLSQLGKNGGSVFLTFGLENIGNRILFLQNYFTKKNLTVAEAMVGKIFYPYLNLHEEDKGNLKRMKKYFSEQKIKKSSQLGADLWIFDYIPFEVKKIKINNSIYSYL